MRTLRHRVRASLLATVLGGPLVLGGCDPTVRDTVLAGVGEAATSLSATFITAFFQSLVGNDDGDNAPMTVKVFRADDCSIFA